MLFQTIILSLPSSLQNILLQLEINKIMIYFPSDTIDCFVDKGSIFWKKGNTVNITVCVLFLCNECWLINRLLVNKVNDTLKYE